MEAAAPVVACGRCGLVQRSARCAPDERLHCARCGRRLPDRSDRELATSRTAAAATAALILYPLAIGLPVLRIERLGEAHTANAWQAATSLLRSGDTAVGVLILCCSILVPLVKILALLDVSLHASRLPAAARARLLSFVAWTGKWSMLDVLLVAMLAAAIKLGDFMTVTAGPGAVTFSAMVAMSMLASACHDERSLWADA
jgi:paraquat-inducible protein A